MFIASEIPWSGSDTTMTWRCGYWARTRSTTSRVPSLEANFTRLTETPARSTRTGPPTSGWTSPTSLSSATRTARWQNRMWDLRDNLAAHDAAYAALSEALGAPLVTCNSRLGGTPGHSATIELFEPRTA